MAAQNTAVLLQAWDIWQHVQAAAAQQESACMQAAQSPLRRKVSAQSHPCHLQGTLCHKQMHRLPAPQQPQMLGLPSGQSRSLQV